ncbi:MAG: ABC transporter permease [Bacillota bacterium]
MQGFREWYLLRNMVHRELRMRYKGSVLGFFWSLVNPIMLMVVYTVIFQFVMRVEVPDYSLYLMAGLLPWNMVTVAVANSVPVVVGNANLVKKIYFPREILPISVVLANFVHLLIGMGLFVLFLLLTGKTTGSQLWLLPIVAAQQLLLTMGISLLVSASYVYFRDLEHIMNLIMMVWFYLTPIVYPSFMVPEGLRWMLILNPMAPIVAGYRQALLGAESVALSALQWPFVLSVLMAFLGFRVFRGLSRRFAEEV